MTGRWVIAGASGGVLAVVGMPLAIVLLVASPAGGSCGVTPADPAHFTVAEISQLWVAEKGPADQAQIAGAVGMAESGGNPAAVGPATRWGHAIGLMQILGAVVPGDLTDPAVNMRNAVKKYEDAHGWTPWEAYTTGAYLRYMAPGLARADAPVCDPGGPIAGTPKEIIDTIVLPLANANGIPRTVAENDMANAMHGPTKGGSTSDHQGPPELAWAADLGNGITTPQEDALAAALAKRFGMPWTGAGLVSVTRGGYRFQLIYRINTPQAGEHYSHVHFGCRRIT